MNRKKLITIGVFAVTLLIVLIILKIVFSQEEQDISNNYYAQEGQTTVQEYIHTPITEMEIQSPEIEELIEKQWYTNQVSFGTEESIYEDYVIYFEEGIEVKTIERKVFNLIFTENYTQNVINEIKVGQAFDTIIDILGEPTFGTKEDGLIGYLGKEIYIFFSENEISIYPVVEPEEDMTEFFALVNQYNEDRNSWNFGNGLTELWKDYDKYAYNQDYADIIYSLKGLRVQFNYTVRNGITLYSNYKGEILEGITLQDLVENPEQKPDYIYLELSKDLVHETEIIRYQEHKFLKNPNTKEGEDEVNPNNSTDSFLLIVTPSEEGYTNLRILSKTGEYPRVELKNVNLFHSYIWFDDTHLLYGIKQKGIYLYDCITRKTHTIQEGNEEFTLQKVENHVLTYDNKTIEIIL